jgi:UDP-N-acetylglucosamine pyrophosphorylase
MGEMGFAEFADKMQKAGASDAAIRSFKHNYETLAKGENGMIPEAAIRPVAELPRFEALGREVKPKSKLLSETVVIKLNGGLGTSMGLERAKSLLPVKDGLTFLDFIARQILHLRREHKAELRFMLMNSFSTSRDTLDFLKKYPDLGDDTSLELMQSQVPKVNAKTLRPVDWPDNRQLEWCPPGHGDLYPSLLGSGRLDRLLAAGVIYAFVSNSDNLGASLDLGLLTYFAESGQSFLMEVARRTASDRKGGHLAERNGRLLLRESAQCPEQDAAAFQDIGRHRFFNTNSIWIRLDRLQELMSAQGGFKALPVIRNAKTVDPRNKNSPPVIQLESAMGAAIECFDKSGAIVVPRARFAPVKTTGDLLALRSDAYRITPDWRLVLDRGEDAEPPAIDLDQNHYKLVDQLDARLKGGAPSLKHCRQLTVRGPVNFSSGNAFYGAVTIRNNGPEAKPLPPGEYRDSVTEL